ncbi:carbohydrate ABC transporter permease [Diplocloster hominis]|uniref:carbohydrate ABC transporter permease n=1 Tax=Diplocloster hominis TaxID=3079010 RepID=UPI0031BB2908
MSTNIKTMKLSVSAARNKSRYGKGDGRARMISRILLILYSLVVAFPILFVIVTSLKSTSEFYTNIWGLPKTFAWENYLTAWNTANIGKYMVNSVIVVGIVLVVTLLAGALAGYALSRFHLKYAELLMLAILACTMMPSESVIMPLYLITSDLGMTGTRISLIIPYIAWGLPMTVYIFRNFFDTIPTELLEAARIDGCTEIQTFGRIVIPLMLPAIATNAVFVFVSWWGELLWATVVLASSTMKTIPIGMVSFSAQFGTNWGPMCAAICIIMVPLIVFFCFVQKYFVQGLTSGGVKG